MLDEKGSFFIIDALLAVVLVLIVFLVVNAVISMPSPDYSYKTKDFTSSQDIMQTLSGKIDFADRSFIGEISDILKENKNSEESVREVSGMCKNKFDNLRIANYEFSETNVLNGEVLASSGDYSKADNVSVAIRSYGDYSYTLSVW